MGGRKGGDPPPKCGALGGYFPRSRVLEKGKNGKEKKKKAFSDRAPGLERTSTNSTVPCLKDKRKKKEKKACSVTS